MKHFYLAFILCISCGSKEATDAAIERIANGDPIVVQEAKAATEDEDEESPSCSPESVGKKTVEPQVVLVDPMETVEVVIRAPKNSTSQDAWYRSMTVPKAVFQEKSQAVCVGGLKFNAGGYECDLGYATYRCALRYAKATPSSTACSYTKDCVEPNFDVNNFIDKSERANAAYSACY